MKLPCLQMKISELHSIVTILFTDLHALAVFLHRANATQSFSGLVTPNRCKINMCN